MDATAALSAWNVPASNTSGIYSSFLASGTFFRGDILLKKATLLATLPKQDYYRL